MIMGEAMHVGGSGIEGIGFNFIVNLKLLFSGLPWCFSG